MLNRTHAAATVAMGALALTPAGAVYVMAREVVRSVMQFFRDNIDAQREHMFMFARLSAVSNTLDLLQACNSDFQDTTIAPPLTMTLQVCARLCFVSIFAYPFFHLCCPGCA